MPAALEDVGGADHVAFDVGQRVLDRIAHARLRREVDHALEPLAGEKPGHARAVREVELDEAEPRELLQHLEPRELEAHIVVVVEVVEPDDLVAALEQLAGRVIADEASGAGDQDLHSRPSTSPARNTYLMS